MDFTYLESPARKYTFETHKIRHWVEDHSKGYVLNLFAGKTKLNLDEVRVDLDPVMKPDFQMDAYNFIQYWKGSKNRKFDTIIMDPPYNLRKAKELYNGNYMSSLNRIREELNDIINEKGIVICFGFNTTNMGRKRGFRKTNILLINHGGSVNDTIGIVETRINGFIEIYLTQVI